MVMNKDQSSKQVGNKAEDLAAEFLKSRGYEIIERNYRYGKGEIDIIALDPENNFTVFVEVKSRDSLEFGDPINAMTRGKIKQVKRIAELYLYEKVIKEVDCRFDVITVVGPNSQEPELEHWVNAFDY